jgi:hypothetical protein
VLDIHSAVKSIERQNVPQQTVVVSRHPFLQRHCLLGASYDIRQRRSVFS